MSSTSPPIGRLLERSCSIPGPDIDAWHCALEFKESFQHYYYEQGGEALREGPYNSTKLLKLLDALIEEAGMVSPTV